MGFWAPWMTSRQQRCWQHKTMNCLPKLSQPKAKAAIHNIWQAETKDDAEKAFDLFIKTYEAKYPKATLCLQKDRTELMAFFDFPAQHWQSIRTSNPIEVRLRHDPASHQALKGLPVTRWHAAHDVQAGPMR